VPQDCPPGTPLQKFSPGYLPGIGGDPLWATPFAGSQATIRFDPAQQDYNSQYGWAVTLLLVVKIDNPNLIMVQGENLRSGAPLWFDFSWLTQGAATVVAVHPGVFGQERNGEWTSWIGYLYIPAAGCYALQASWPGGGWMVTFAAGR
jgi:hypothetical protein